MHYKIYQEISRLLPTLVKKWFFSEYFLSSFRISTFYTTKKFSWKILCKKSIFTWKLPEKKSLLYPSQLSKMIENFFFLSVSWLWKNLLKKSKIFSLFKKCCKVFMKIYQVAFMAWSTFNLKRLKWFLTAKWKIKVKSLFSDILLKIGIFEFEKLFNNLN